MTVYNVDLTGVSGRAELHERLRAALPLPDWYGNNLDALHDVLSEMEGPYELVFRNAAGADESVRDYLSALRRMGVDLMLERPRTVTVRWLGPGKSRFLARAEALRNDPEAHYNCAQGVLVPFAEAAGLSEAAACRIAANFGGGMKRASVCGAITGGLMVLGLFGLEDGAAVGTYYRRLRERHGGLFDCADLLRVDRERGGDKKTHCDGMVYECVSLAEELLRERGKL